MTPGTHGAPLAAIHWRWRLPPKVVQFVGNEAFLADVRLKGDKLRAGLEALAAEYSEVFAEVRGEGLLLGLRCVPPVEAVATAARANGLLSVVAGENVLRLLPPLILSDAEIDEGAARLGRAACALSKHDVAASSAGETERA